MKTRQVDFETAAQLLSEDINEARATHNRNLIRRIRRCWQFNAFGQGSRRGDTWASILRKVDTEGSAWAVWWADGVRVYASRLRLVASRRARS